MRYEYKYAALAAVTAMLWGTANAQSPARNDDANYARAMSYDDYLADSDLRASKLVGASVRNAQGEDLGEIEELLIPSADADEMLLIVSVGGFLGVGDKLVAVPYEELRVSPTGDVFYVNRTQEQLQAAPAFSYGGHAEEHQTGAGAATRASDGGLQDQAAAHRETR